MAKVSDWKSGKILHFFQQKVGLYSTVTISMIKIQRPFKKLTKLGFNWLDSTKIYWISLNHLVTAETFQPFFLIFGKLPNMITTSPDSMATRSFGKRCKKVVGFSSGGKRHASERPDRGGGAPVQQGGDHGALQGIGLLFVILPFIAWL